MKTYAVYSKNLEERLDSSSGGVFSLFAKVILRDKGAVYGVAMSSDNRYAEYIRVDEEKGLDRLRGSKYLQVKTSGIYKSVKEDLGKGLYVLFTGTACQINGLLMFLGKEYDNLFCVDVICHGVSSPALWNKYVLYIEEKYKSKLIDVKFRCKDKSWTYFGMKEEFMNKQIFTSKYEDPFMVMFLKNYCLRPSCYKCIAKTQKKSDISIGDFWGINNVAPEMNDEKGTSLVIIRSKKGKLLFERILMDLEAKEVKYEEALKYNLADYESVNRPEQRNTFFYDMNNMSFEELKGKYYQPILISNKTKVKRFIKRMVKKLGE